MFNRLTYEEWTTAIVFISFFIFLVVFALISYRAFRMAPNTRERLAAMPLDDSQPQA
jgi:hypothetical protein